MKNKVFIISAIIALVVFVAAFGRGDVWAQQGQIDEEPTEPFDKIKYPIQVKFNTCPDLQANGGDIGGPLAEQVVVTYVPDKEDDDYPDNDVNYGGQNQVDAIANHGDAYFWTLIDNRANLLVSVRGDTKGKGVWKVWMEDVAGNAHHVWRDSDFNNKPDPKVDSLEALQLWSGVANRYSKEGDPTGAVMDEAGVYITRTQIWTALQSARLDTDGGEHFTGDSTQVDVDALMVWDTSEPGTWGTGDAIVFSVEKAQNWDGGEIVVFPHGQAAYYLNHGDHLWHTPHDVQGTLGTDGEDVDAIEAAGTWFTWQTPTLTQWGLVILIALLVASSVFLMLRRRKAAVPA